MGLLIPLLLRTQPPLVVRRQDRLQDVSATFLQPCVSYTTKTFTTFRVNMESTYDWENEQWTMPFNGSVRQLLKIDPQPIQLSLGGRAYADRPYRRIGLGSATCRATCAGPKCGADATRYG